jgi:hypothetical protein
MSNEQQWPGRARTFFAILMSGALILGFINLGRAGTTNPELARITSATNTGGYLVAAIACALATGWKWPIFARVLVTHLVTASLLGFVTEGARGFAYAFGSSLLLAPAVALPSWLMLRSDWLFGKIIFWGLATLFGVGVLMILFR